MDLSSSTTQRSTSSEGLSIQPGSVRSPVADAANEFARHLAENNRPDPRPRRDERPADRSERHDLRAEHNRSSREDETETRKTTRKEDETAEPRARKTEETGHAAAAEQQMTADTKETGTTEGTSGTEPSTEEATEAKTSTEKNTTEDDTASATSAASEGDPSTPVADTSAAVPADKTLTPPLGSKQRQPRPKHPANPRQSPAASTPPPRRTGLHPRGQSFHRHPKPLQPQ